MFARRRLVTLFSAFVFDKLLASLDDEKIYFTKEDIAALQPYKLRIDDDILKQKTGYLQAITTHYIQKMKQSDCLITLVHGL